MIDIALQNGRFRIERSIFQILQIEDYFKNMTIAYQIKELNIIFHLMGLSVIGRCLP